MMMTPARKEPDAKTYAGRFAIHLKKLRVEAGLTVDQAADKLGVSYKTVYAWEASTNAPHVSAYPLIAELYGLEKIKDILPGE